MKKLSMFLSVIVCSIGLFQSVKGMDKALETVIEAPIQKELVKRYLLEKHLLENSLPNDLVLYIRRVQAALFKGDMKEIQELIGKTLGARSLPKKEIEELFGKTLGGHSLPKEIRDTILRNNQVQITDQIMELHHQAEQEKLRTLEAQVRESFELLIHIVGQVSIPFWLNVGLDLGQEVLRRPLPSLAIVVAFYTINYDLLYVNDVLNFTNFHENL